MATDTTKSCIYSLGDLFPGVVERKPIPPPNFSLESPIEPEEDAFALPPPARAPSPAPSDTTLVDLPAGAEAYASVIPVKRGAEKVAKEKEEEEEKEEEKKEEEKEDEDEEEEEGRRKRRKTTRKKIITAESDKRQGRRKTKTKTKKMTTTMTTTTTTMTTTMTGPRKGTFNI